jgi:hypothetical protein
MEQALSELKAHAETYPEIRAAVLAVLQGVKLLGDENAFLKQKIFGATQSEKIDPNQLLLMLGGLEAPVEEAGEAHEPPPAATTKPRKKRKSRAMRLPANIEEVREVIIPEEVKADPDAWEHIGSEERTELEVTQPKYTKRVVERRKYVRKASRHLPPVIVPAKPVLIVSVRGFTAYPNELRCVMRRGWKHKASPRRHPPAVASTTAPPKRNPSWMPLSNQV